MWYPFHALNLFHDTLKIKKHTKTYDAQPKQIQYHSNLLMLIVNHATYQIQSFHSHGGIPIAGWFYGKSNL